MVKVISLSDEAYEKLKKIKNDNSFSEVVVSLVESKREKLRGSELIGKFSGIFSDEEADMIMKDVRENRKKQKMREVRF